MGCGFARQVKAHQTLSSTACLIPREHQCSTYQSSTELRVSVRQTHEKSTKPKPSALMKNNETTVVKHPSTHELNWPPTTLPARPQLMSAVESDSAGSSQESKATHQLFERNVKESAGLELFWSRFCGIADSGVLESVFVRSDTNTDSTNAITPLIDSGARKNNEAELINSSSSVSITSCAQLTSHVSIAGVPDRLALNIPQAKSLK